VLSRANALQHSRTSSQIRAGIATEKHALSAAADEFDPSFIMQIKSPLETHHGMQILQVSPRLRIRP
jgi:hypothetical protein